MLHGDEGIKSARIVVRLPEANKFDKAELSKVASTPWGLHRPRQTEIIFKDKKEEQEDLMRENKIALSREQDCSCRGLHRPRQTEIIFKDKKEEQEDLMRESKIALPRAVYTKPEDLTKLGLKRGCPKCDHQIAYSPGRTSKPHSAKCRARIMGELANTPEGRTRIAAAAERLDRTVAELGNQYRGDIPKGRSQRLCNISASQRWFQKLRLSLSPLMMLGQFENLHMNPGRRLLPLMMTGMSKLMKLQVPFPKLVVRLSLAWTSILSP